MQPSAKKFNQLLLNIDIHHIQGQGAMCSYLLGSQVSNQKPYSFNLTSPF